MYTYGRYRKIKTRVSLFWTTGLVYTQFTRLLANANFAAFVKHPKARRLQTPLIGSPTRGRHGLQFHLRWLLLTTCTGRGA